MERWRRWRVVRFAALLSCATIPSQAQPPSRVMSMNVCTDQLAMELAAPGQLVSVSQLAANPALSFHADLAGRYPHNRGLAEEVIVARPDLVVTGSFSMNNTTGLLRGLGYSIEEFPYNQTIDSVPADIRHMGRVLGRSGEAEAIARRFARDLAAAQVRQCPGTVTAIAYDQNGVVSGEGTLIDSAMNAAGLHNIAADLGFSGMVPFPLELLVKTKPQVIVLPDVLSDKPAMADMIVDHPAIRALDTSLAIRLPPGSAACGGPFVIEAVKALAAARDRVLGCKVAAP